MVFIPNRFQYETNAWREPEIGRTGCELLLLPNREFLLDTWSRPTVRLETCAMKFCGYETGDFFDEMFGENGQPRAAARPLARNIESLPDGELVNRQQAADQALIQMGITFNVYGESAGMEKTLPFDLVPRIVQAAEWDRIERGLKQRIRALNLSETAHPGAESVHRRSLSRAENHPGRRGGGGDRFHVEGVPAAMRRV